MSDREKKAAEELVEVVKNIPKEAEVAARAFMDGINTGYKLGKEENKKENIPA